uniref:C2H2-type domain-containing protein n=1 Tax=Ditylenchus dipsaci TaxID=166011 RepID=A0A915EJ53_9BILA
MRFQLVTSSNKINTTATWKNLLYVYKDCLIATKDGYEAVFKQITGGKNQAVLTQSTPVSAVKEVVHHQIVSSDSSSNSDNDVQLLPNPTPPSVKMNPVQERKQRPSVSVQKTVPVIQSKEVAKTDSSSVSGSEHKKLVYGMEMAELHRQINRGHLTQSCNRCRRDVTNNYMCHKEHVLQYHRSMQTKESKEAFVARLIKFCFPMAVAVNDLQCGICSCEVNVEGRKTHLNRKHLLFYLECPVKSCLFNSLCENTIAIHLMNVHKVSVRELKTEEKTAFERERIAYNAKMKPYLSRCFPCSVSSKEAKKREKEVLAEIRRELFKKSAKGNGASEIIVPRSNNYAAVHPSIETPQSALCPNNSNRNNGFDGASTSTRQDPRSSHSPGGSTVTVKGARSQHFGSVEIQSMLDDKARQSGNRDYRAAPSSPKIPRCLTLDLQAVVTPASKLMSDWLSGQSPCRGGTIEGLIKQEILSIICKFSCSTIFSNVMLLF